MKTILFALGLASLVLAGCDSKAKCLEQCSKQASECPNKTGDAQKMCLEAAKTCPADLCGVK